MAKTFEQEAQSLAISLQLIAQEPGPTAVQAMAELQQMAKKKHVLDMRKRTASIAPIGPWPKLREPSPAEVDRFIAEKSQIRRLAEWGSRARTVFSQWWPSFSNERKAMVHDIVASIQSQTAQGTICDLSVMCLTLHRLSIAEKVQSAVQEAAVDERDIPRKSRVDSPREPKRAPRGTDPGRWVGSAKIALLRHLLANPQACPRDNIARSAKGAGTKASILANLVDLKAAGWLAEGEMGTCLSEKGIRKAGKKLG